MEFDPIHNKQDKLKLKRTLDELWLTIQREISKKRGKLVINEKEYEFFGWGQWVAPWMTWFQRKMDEINDDVRGYRKRERWDDVGKIIVKYGTMNERDRPTTSQVLQELMAIMEKPDKEPVDPTELQGKYDEIYKTINDQILRRLLSKESFAAIDDVDVPVIWDRIRQHIAEQEAMALNFLDYSEELAGIVSNTIQKLEENPPQQPSA